jgi:hypothetical protein
VPIVWGIAQGLAPSLTSWEGVPCSCWLGSSLTPDHVLLEAMVLLRRFWNSETSLLFTALASRVERLSKRLARLGMAAPSLGNDCAGPLLLVLRSNLHRPLWKVPVLHLAQRGGTLVGRLDRAVATSTYGKVVGIVPLAHHRFPDSP